MRHFIAFLLTLSTFPLYALAAPDLAERQELDGINLLAKKNPGFENGKTNWTASSSPTFTLATSGGNLFAPGTTSAVFDASASAQTLCSALMPIGTFQNLSASIYSKTTASDYKLQIRDGSAVVLRETLIVPSTTFELHSISVPMPSSGSVRLCVASQSNAAAVALDKAFLGRNQVLQLSQASYFGGITYPRVNNCTWSATPTSAFGGADFAADSDCTGAVTRGNAQAPGTLIPAIKFASIPEGDLVCKIPQGLLNNSASTGLIQWRLSDGSFLHSTRHNQSVGGTANTNVAGEFIFHLTSPASNVTLLVQSASDTASQGAEINNDLASSTLYPDFSIDCYHYPTKTSLAAGSEAHAFRASALIGSGNAYSATQGGAFATFSDAEFATKAYSGSASAPGTANDFAITVGNIPPGSYFVYARAPMEAYTTGAATANCNFRITDGTNAIQTTLQSVSVAGLTNRSTTNFIGGIVSYAALQSSLEFKLQGNLAASTGTADCRISDGTSSGMQSEIGIIPITQALPGHQLVNTVVTPLAGVMQIVSVAFAGDSGETTACTSDPCTIVRQSGGVSSVTRVSAGLYEVNFTAGTFSSPPVCTGAAFNFTTQGFVSGAAVPYTTTKATIYVFTHSGAASDEGVHLICIGPE